MPAAANAAAPHATPQIYALAGKHPDQVVMLSNWPEGRRFAEYVDPEKQTAALFHAGQAVWTWCDRKSAESRIERLGTDSGDLGLTTIKLAASPGCDQRALLLSSHELPPQRWVAKAATEQDVARIAAGLGPARNLQVTRIQSDTHGAPEFLLPSSDGLDAWLIRMFPALDRELALRSRPATRPGTDPG